MTLGRLAPNILWDVSLHHSDVNLGVPVQLTTVELSNLLEAYNSCRRIHESVF